MRFLSTIGVGTNLSGMEGVRDVNFGNYGGLPLRYNVRNEFLKDNRDKMLQILLNDIKHPIKQEFYDELTDVGDGHPLTLTYLKEKYSRNKIKTATKVWKNINLQEWLSTNQDNCDIVFETVFPFRSKDDKRIRNIRSYDVLLFLRRVEQECPKRYQLIRRLLNGDFYGPIDYIFCCNIILYICLTNDSVLEFWDNSDIIKLGTWGFVDVVKKMSDEIKSSRKGDYAWNNLTELGCLAGYKNPPIPGFNISEETQSLAHGGEEHNYPFNFDDYANKHLSKVPYYKVKGMGFREYIQSGMWVTSGSSSEGKIVIKDLVTGDIKTIKCRKNFVLDVVSTDTLYESCLSSNHQSNKVLLKCELGKIRLAVAGDLQNYIQTSYIVYLSGSNYLNWEGVTLEENTSAKVERLMDIKSKLRFKVAVPFDFKAFDHQVKTDETISISMQLVYSADKLGYEFPDYSIIRRNVIESFSNATLSVNINSREYTDLWGESQTMEGADFSTDITGGLPSGVRLTSVLGNGYNKTVTSMVVDCLCILGEDRKDFYYNVQGDDTNLMCKTKRQGLMIIRLYQMFNIKFDRGKFSVQVGNTEYLRVWFSSERTFSYMSRTLPNLTQRKPWSNTPWSPSGVISGIWDKIGILKRRDCDTLMCDILWGVLMTRWCVLHSIPTQAVSVPSELGGLGIGVWNGIDTVQPKIPTVGKRGYEIQSETTYRADKLRERAKVMKISFPVDYTKMAQDELLGVVSGDDVPAIAIMNRRQWKLSISRTIFRITPIHVKTILNADSVQTFSWDSNSYNDWAAQVGWLKHKTSTYGSCKHAVMRLKNYKEFRNNALDRRGTPSLSDWCRLNEPYLWSKLQVLRRKGHMTEVLDYLGGNINLGENVINKDVSDIFTRYCMVRLNPVLRKNDIKAYYGSLREVMINGFSNNSVYQYCFSKV
jgi:hypothetical protein